MHYLVPADKLIRKFRFHLGSGIDALFLISTVENEIRDLYGMENEYSHISREVKVRLGNGRGKQSNNV